MDTGISKACLPSEIEQAHKRITAIRFDCFVKMFDFAKAKGRPPQSFKMEMYMTLEFIRYGNEFDIGKAIKDAYRKLEKTIDDYEKQTI